MQWAGLGAGLGIGSVALVLMGAQGQPPAIPDAPTPRVSLPKGGVTPGAGTTSVSEPGDTALPADTTPTAAGTGAWTGYPTAGAGTGRGVRRCRAPWRAAGPSPSWSESRPAHPDPAEPEPAGRPGPGRGSASLAR